MDAVPGTADCAAGRWGVFARRDFRLLWAGETASGLGSSITAVALPLTAVVVLDAGAMAVGLLSAAVWAPWLVIGLPIGAWVDRIRRRRLMVVCDVVAAVALLSVPVAAWADRLTLGHLLVVALVCGATAVCFSTAHNAYVPTVLPRADLAAGNAALQAGEAATRVVGPGAAGALTQLFGAVTGLLADAVTFLVSAFCLARIDVPEPAPPRREGREPLRVQIMTGLRFVARDRYLRAMVTWGAVINMALVGYQAVQVVFLVRTLGVDPGVVGLLLSCGSVGAVGGALLAARIGRRIGTARGLLLLQVGTAPAALLLPLATAGPGLVLFALGAFVVAIGIAVANVLVGTFRQTYVPPAVLGRVVATCMVVNYSAIPLGALVGGVLGDAVGPRAAMFAMTGVVAASWLLLVASPVRRRRDLPESP